MKITIFVEEKYLENLNKFLTDGQERPIEYHHDRPGTLGVQHYAVTISYGDFIQLEHLSE